jgi:glutamyl-tRNA synthetase
LAQVILDGLSWLGIESDEPVVYQSEHLSHHTAIANELVKKGAAYYDFTTPEELEKLRLESQARKEPAFRFTADPKQMNAEASARLARGETYAIRFAAPREGLSWNDCVHDSISFAGEDLDDFVLVRRDGFPTYHLSVVCDDHDMCITHVIRGDDHISNTPKQISIYRAMGWPIPEFAHVPLILGSDKKRLSKRTGATSVGEFQERGYLPSALFNFLALLGWSPGAGDREIFSREDLIKCFSLAGVQPKSAVFDESKLEWMNGEHLRRLTLDQAMDYLMRYSNGAIPDATYLIRILPLILPRIRMPRDLIEGHGYFFVDPDSYDPSGVNKHFGDHVLLGKLKDYREELSLLDSFEEKSLESHLRSRSEAWGVSAGKLIHPLRLALTGKTVSPGLFEMMEALGRDTVLRRLDRALSTFART